jgi:hypothetical protein
VAITNDPITKIAFSLYENKGVFALLLGSGLSRAADIPTGWEITLNLIRRVAMAEGVTGRNGIETKRGKSQITPPSLRSSLPLRKSGGPFYIHSLSPSKLSGRKEGNFLRRRIVQSLNWFVAAMSE